MKAFVIHIEPNANGFCRAVAEVQFAKRKAYPFDGIYEQSLQVQEFAGVLDYAFRWTNNIEGSWSKDGNSDTNPNVTFLGEYFVDEEGVEYGARSTTVGDLVVLQFPLEYGHYEVLGVYRVANFGFEHVATRTVNIDGWDDIDNVAYAKTGDSRGFLFCENGHATRRAGAITSSRHDSHVNVYRGWCDAEDWRESCEANDRREAEYYENRGYWEARRQQEEEFRRGIY